MKRFGIYLAVLSAVVLLPKLYAGDVSAEKLKAAKCPMSGKAVTAESGLAFADGMIYFCCDNCKGKFDKSNDKQVAKANAQLVATEQYVQKTCPLSGEAVDKEQSIKVAGAPVAFCCGNCKGKAEKMEADAAVAKIFSKDSFAKNFKKADSKG